MDCPSGQTRIDPSLPCIPTDPVQFVGAIYKIGLGFLGMVAILFLIIGGYQILTSQGDPDKVKKGKTYIFYSIAGFLLAAFGFVFMQIIAVNVLHIPGFS